MRLGSTNSPSASLEVKASGATLTSTIWSHVTYIFFKLETEHNLKVIDSKCVLHFG